MDIRCNSTMNGKESKDTKIITQKKILGQLQSSMSEWEKSIKKYKDSGI